MTNMALSGRHPSPLKIVGLVLLPLLWIAFKYGLGISDRYLPHPAEVLRAFVDLDPGIGRHATATALRCVFGFIFGTTFGLVLGVAVNSSWILRELLYPTVQSMRSTPAPAFIPFFLLWLGFSEFGKLLLVITGIGFNVAIAVDQLLENMPEKYRLVFRNIQRPPSSLAITFCVPYVIGEILPTLRFSLSTAIGVVFVSEMLGAQVGLGYLIQTSRSTFSMHVIFAAAGIMGMLNVVLDYLLVAVWRFTVRWK